MPSAPGRDPVAQVFSIIVFEASSQDAPPSPRHVIASGVAGDRRGGRAEGAGGARPPPGPGVFWITSQRSGGAGGEPGPRGRRIHAARRGGAGRPPPRGGARVPAAGTAGAAPRPGPAGDPGPKGLRSCGTCGGTGEVACGVCGGSGRLARGGFQRNNPVKVSKLVGSKWTSQQKHLGKDYFVVKELQKLGPKHTVVLVEACTAPERKLWLNTELLKDKSAWAPGWVEGMCRTSVADSPEARPCPACSGGSGRAACPSCAGSRPSVYAI